MSDPGVAIRRFVYRIVLDHPFSTEREIVSRTKEMMLAKGWPQVQGWPAQRALAWLVREGRVEKRKHSSRFHASEWATYVVSAEAEMELVERNAPPKTRILSSTARLRLTGDLSEVQR